MRHFMPSVLFFNVQSLILEYIKISTVQQYVIIIIYYFKLILIVLGTSAIVYFLFYNLISEYVLSLIITSLCISIFVIFLPIFLGEPSINIIYCSRLYLATLPADVTGNCNTIVEVLINYDGP